MWEVRVSFALLLVGRLGERIVVRLFGAGRPLAHRMRIIWAEAAATAAAVAGADTTKAEELDMADSAAAEAALGARLSRAAGGL